ncbi:oxin biosynthesis protein [Streptomyces fodineus]|uniref:Oxin biosynthesis protein n=1 Tax=Streptomyces fodineus TaxID=1904616 RepID=A0A1D7YG08_9ACTN|nr:methyltransferase domain-containing protein [Streptomyces fodineus]AOR34259.1 oxin biosynthesis protein [Streptomyces fodineus]
MTQNLKSLLDYYETPRSDGETIYGIWERGEAFNDSVTPSTYVPEYRTHVLLKFLSLIPEGSRIFSFGCGNAAVEGALVEHGRHVSAIDVCPEAVELACKKGVDATAADYFAISPDDVAGFDAIYADGFLGHLFDSVEEVGPILQKLKELDLKSGTVLLFSNDAPPERDASFTAHERVDNFWYLSKDYLATRLADAGFELLESYYFPYARPLSGLRNRTICVARVP